MKKIPQRIFAGLSGLVLFAVSVKLIIQQANGDGIDLNEESWAINFIPGIFWVMMLLMIPMGIAIYFLIYAIKGEWPKK